MRARDEKVCEVDGCNALLWPTGVRVRGLESDPDYDKELCDGCHSGLRWSDDVKILEKEQLYV